MEDTEDPSPISTETIGLGFSEIGDSNWRTVKINVTVKIEVTWFDSFIPDYCNKYRAITCVH